MNEINKIERNVLDAYFSTRVIRGIKRNVTKWKMIENEYKR